MLKIYTIAHKRADLIELQLQSFRKNLQEEFEFIVINNDCFDTNKEDYNKINRVCHQLKIQVIDVRKNEEMTKRCQTYETCAVLNGDGTYGNPNIAVAYALCFTWENIICKETCKICLIDSDMFLTKSVKLTNYLQNHHMSFIAQSRHNELGEKVCEYIWSPGFILADLSKLPEPEIMNFWCGRVDNIPVDTGGQTHYYLQKHPELKINYIRSNHMEDDPQVNFHPANYETLLIEDEPIILHYRSATNWDHKSEDYHQKKTRWLKEQLK